MAKQEYENLPLVSAIVAKSVPGNIIGRNNALPWRLGSDLAHFKKLTLGHALIMGRKTFDSLPRPLPGRLNIVLSGQSRAGSQQVIRAPNRDAALYHADKYSLAQGKDELFVIGGAAVFLAFSDIISRFWVTQVFAPSIDGDIFFPFQFNTMEWKEGPCVTYPVGIKDEFEFAITCYERRQPVVRTRPA